MKSHKLRRTFEDVQDARGTAPIMTVLQWNVLADGLAQYGEFERVRNVLLCNAQCPCPNLHGEGNYTASLNRTGSP